MTGGIEVKDAVKGIVAGYASTFGGEPDSYGDIVQPGAFAASLAAHKAAGTAPLMLWAHDASEVPVGTWLNLREDSHGLYVEGQLNLDVAKARDIASALRAKSTGSFSIGFRTPKGGRVPGTKAGTYNLRQVDLVEISLVNIPANIRARVTSAKAAPTTNFANRLAAATAEMKDFMNFYAPIVETKNGPADVEIKDGGDIEARFEEYHSANKAALEAAEQRADDLEARLNRIALGTGGGGMDTKAKAIEAEHKAFGRFIKDGNETELKALSAGNDPAGGYVVDTNMSRVINQKVFDQSPLRRLSRVITLTSGDGWSEPRDWSDLGAEWVSESESRPETDNPDLGMLTIPLNEVYATQLMTQKLMELSFVDIGGWIEGKIADKFSRTEGLAYLSGNGIGKPKGMLSYATDTAGDATRAIDVIQTVNSGTAATIADADGQANGLKNLVWSLRAPYRANANWLMNSTTAASLDRLKDANKNYLWKSSNTAGAPDELLGYPVEFEENMPSEGAGLTPVAFGDYRLAYTVVDWSGVKMLRDPYTNKPHLLVYAYRRTGGGLSNSEAVKLLKCAS